MDRVGWKLRSATLVGVTAIVCGLVLLSGGSAANDAATQKYTQARFPSYLRTVNTVAELMPAARALVRNKSSFQGFGLGAIKQGQHIVLVATISSEDMALQAITQALNERGVKVTVLKNYELVGVSKQDALELKKETYDVTNADDKVGENFGEARNWFMALPNPEKAKAWLKARNPALYAKAFPPTRELSPHLDEVRMKLRGQEVGPALSKWLDKHPEIDGVFWGKGGSSYERRYIHPYEAKMIGLFLWDNQYEILNGMSKFPDDVWMLAETQTLDPLAYIDGIHVTDPQGTDMSADLTEEQAQKFERGVYHRGHMFMNPNQAYGRFGYSVIDYPNFEKDWLSPEPMVVWNGVVAGTHQEGTGSYPRIEVHYTNGYVTKVVGGGTMGDLYREALHYPGINDLTYPFYNHKGYFYSYEFALGTNPKSSYYPDGTSPQRERSGVFHLATGVFVQHGPNSLTMPKEWIDFTNKNNLPIDHGWHTMNYQATYAVHLRNANKWVNLVQGGHLTALDSPEVRALASRYGNPDQILAEDWIPNIPGISSPGSYSDFAKEPWKFVAEQDKEILAGTYKYFYPPVKK
jgi:hypothetical protein